jgi:hypothetical protein
MYDGEKVAPPAVYGENSGPLIGLIVGDIKCNGVACELNAFDGTP